MSDFPTLKEMGINNPHEIMRYTCHIHNNVDHLRIIYERKPGSFLPVTRRYQFGRSSKMVVADGGTNQYDTVYEISPILQKALKELDQVIAQNNSPQNQKQHIMEELSRLESDLQSQLQSLKSLVEKL